MLNFYIGLKLFGIAFTTIAVVVLAVICAYEYHKINKNKKIDQNKTPFCLEWD